MRLSMFYVSCLDYKDKPLWHLEDKQCKLSVDEVGTKLYAIFICTSFSLDTQQCNKDIHLESENSSYVFWSPNYPKNCDNNLNCEWMVTTSPGLFIHLEFNDFQLEDEYDFLNIAFAGNEYNVMFTGLTFDSLVSNINTMWIALSTDEDQTKRGFNATVTALIVPPGN
ncbi:venom CUB domain-containing protein 2-like [Antedon mediterranea]|uniref:venom CUB domain-containing protein 2-like n=1 Tax=Antedon mediterranea TaxID=105859 RepID=UPI003AF50E4A